MKDYRASTSHSVGLRWDISAPKTTSIEQVEAMIEALLDYCDTPNQKELQNMLTDTSYLEGCGLEAKHLEGIEIYTDRVHSEAFIADEPEEVE